MSTQLPLFNDVVSAACEKDAERVFALAYPVFALLFSIEALSHITSQERRYLWVPVLFSVSLALFFMFSRTRTMQSYGSLLLVPWVFTMGSLWMHIGLDQLDIAMIFSSVTVVGTGALVMPFGPMLIAMSGSVVFLVYLLFQAGEGLWIFTSVPTLITGIGVLVYYGRRYAIAHGEALRDRELKLAEAQHELSLKEARKVTAMAISAAMTHHINNQLQVFSGNAEIAQRIDPQAAPALDAITQSAEKVAQLTAKLHQYVGRQAGQLEVFDFNVATINQRLEELVPPYITLKVISQMTSTRILGRQEELYLAIENCMRNAIEAVSAEQEAVITIEFRQDEDWTIITISDTGCGMNNHQIARATEPFFTTHGPTQEGLGLSVVQGIVNQHNGRLTIRSTHQLGTDVEIYLPKLPASYEL